MPRDFDTVPDGLITKSEGNTQAPAADDAVAKALAGLTAQVTDALKANADAVAALKADFEGYKADNEKKFSNQKPPEQKPEGQGDTQKAAADDAVMKAVAALKDELASVKTALNRPSFNMGKGEAKELNTEEKGLAFARCVRALACSKGDVRWAAELLEKDFNDPISAKALATNPMSAGGAIIPIDYSTALIELLRPFVVIRNLAGGPLPMPMPHGNMTIPNHQTGAQANWIGENQPITTSQQSFGQKKLQARKLAALVPASNELIAYSSPAADQVVLNDIREALAIKEDETLLRGAASAIAPTGLRNLALSAHVIGATGGLSHQDVSNNLMRLQLLLKSANVRMQRPGWIMSPRTETFLLSLLDASGKYAYQDQMLTGKILNIPYASTTSIPDNLGSGGNASEIILVDMAQVYLGEGRPLRIDASREAAYFDGASIQSSFGQDQTIFRAIEEVDMIMRQDAAVAVLTDVTWTV